MNNEKGDNDLEKIIEDLKSKVKDLEEINNGSSYRIADLENIIQTLTQRVKELEDINEGHRQLNGQLRVEVQMWKDMASEHEKTKNLLQGYKKVIEDLSKQVTKK